MNNWVVLITTCVHPPHILDKQFDRQTLYTKQINKWLDSTNLPIFVIESSGTGFDIQHERLHVITCDLKGLPSSSLYEAYSITHAIHCMQQYSAYKNCTHILKVTGRYYLKNIEGVLGNVTDGLDGYLQHHFNNSISWQHSEYFGIKKEHMLDMVYLVKEQNLLMEHALYTFMCDKSFERIGTFPNDQRRGGDNLLLTNL